jgi:ABC-2 type transport system ATP-binding protein
MFLSRSRVLTSVTGRRTTALASVGAVESAIEVTDLGLAYGDLRAVDDVSFEVAAGEFFGILGPNGAGKTSTLEMIEGLRKPDAGEIRLLGERPWPRNAGLLPRIGVQLQASSFFERLTAREQIHTFASLYGVGPGPADEWLERVALEDKATTRVENLSGGQVQRLSIACALVHDPEVVFLDEPTAALDPQARRNLWDLLSGLNESGRTVVLTTHYMDEAEVLCDRVAIMDHGKVLRLDSPAALIRGLDAPTRITVAPGQLSLAEGQALAAVDRAEEGPSGLVLTTRSPAGVLTDLAESGRLDGIQVQSGTLEDVFLDVTGREYRA